MRTIAVLLLAIVVRAQDPVPPATPLTGPLDEAAFRALHELTGEKAPAPRGVAVEIGPDKAYLSLPEGAKAPLPAVLVIHEWWGLNDHIRHWTDRIAALGYAALAVDLYGGTVATTPEAAMAAMKAVDPARSRETLKRAFEFLGSDPRILAGKRAVIGWCFGGSQSLGLALAEPRLDAAVIYYGRLVTDPAQLAAIKARVLGIFGTRDASIPEEQVAAFEAGLAAAGVRHEILRYDAAHAFANPSSARYDAKAAADAWTKVQAFLAQALR
jgi:carboxymethylenebutenolidase